MMTVGELIGELRAMPRNAEVFFDSGMDDEPCSVIDRVEFNESPDKLVIDYNSVTRLVAEGVFLS